MGTKAENSRRIRELEEELSDERIAELFHLDDPEIHVMAEQARRKKRETTSYIIIAAALVVSIVLAGYYLVSIV